MIIVIYYFIAIYLFIGIFKTIIIFLQPLTNRPIAVLKRQWGAIFYGLIFWLPLLLLRIKNFGIKTAFKWEIRGIKNVFKK